MTGPSDARSTSVCIEVQNHKITDGVMVYDRFTVAFDTDDLKDAKALLEASK